MRFVSFVGLCLNFMFCLSFFSSRGFFAKRKRFKRSFPSVRERAGEVSSLELCSPAQWFCFTGCSGVLPAAEDGGGWRGPTGRSNVRLDVVLRVVQTKILEKMCQNLREMKEAVGIQGESWG